jgi:glycosyltransferase involved in cell wall biosynthesis
MKVALLMVVVSDLAGSGGAERQFSHLHEFMTAAADGADVTLITAARSLERLRAAGRLTRAPGVLTFRLGSHPARGKVAVAWLTWRLLWATLIRRFDLVHVCLPTPTYVPFLAVLSRLPRSLRPRLVLNVIDCTLSESLEKAPPAGTYERQVLDAHRMYFRWAKLDGLFSWYRAFVETAANGVRIAGHPVMRAARFCFTDPSRFQPASIKDDLVVFAGRLSEQKRPLMFVDAIATLRKREPQLIAGWRFEMYGRGVLQPAVADRIAQHGLADILTVTHAMDMAPIFARSRLFVSTQAFENFTSLSMLEAMAAGNAVIAEDVGQTREFVRDGENGLLVRTAAADDFAAAMADYLRHPERHAALAAASRHLATSVHTIEHFADDITTFWHDVLQQRA